MKRILVIDDELGVRKSFVLALEDMACIVDTAESGKKGIEMEKADPYHLIFLDLRMPGMNGVETLRALKKVDKTVLVYIVTAFHKEFFTGLKEAMADGIDFELLKKPIGLDQIQMVVKSVLEGPVAC